ncbi:hypothetical protein [Chroococcidiopsis sp. SAG 2025]|nr:hypothetical protein [Chroococcidiopsis sp. SAG 2025]
MLEHQLKAKSQNAETSSPLICDRLRSSVFKILKIHHSPRT